MINKIEAKKAHCGGAQSSASVSGALGAAAQCAPMAPPLSNRGGAENSRAESNEQESFEHYSTFITDSKGRLIEVPLRRGVGNSAFIDQISFSFHEDTLSICAGEPLVADDDYMIWASLKLESIFGFGIAQKASHSASRLRAAVS